MTKRAIDISEALRALGWRTPSAEDLHLETTGPRDFQICRAWSSQGVWASTPAPGRLSALLVTEGACLIEHGSRELALGENHVMLLDSAVPTRISVLKPTVRYLWHFQAAVLRNTVMQRGFGIPYRLERSTWLPLTSLSNSLFSAGSVMTDSLNTARSIEHLLAAVLNSAPETAPRIQRPDASDAFAGAIALMEKKKHLSTFTVRDVARHFNMSDRKLQRIFARYSTTPRRELERQRVQDLRDALTTAPTEVLADRRAFALLASDAGFVTSTQARAALQRTESTRED